MNKTPVVLALIAGCFSNAYACSVPNSTSTNIREIVGKNGGWPISDASCTLLNKHGLSLDVSAEATVLSNVSVGWAAVRLIDDSLNIASDAGRVSTFVNSSSASMDLANDLAYAAIKNAVAQFDFTLAAKQIANYKMKITSGKP